ncbi:hypothetical protein CQJ94_02390 [Glycomyces fuscus]|nr:hypothetical protein CQJ94_02390 [Glycomyces fuscus]
MEKGFQAEAMAEAMVGLEQTFELLMEELKSKSGWMISSGYSAFKQDLQPEILKVQQNGLQLANSIQAGASEIAQNDYESSNDYAGAWENLPEVNWD